MPFASYVKALHFGYLGSRMTPPPFPRRSRFTRSLHISRSRLIAPSFWDTHDAGKYKWASREWAGIQRANNERPKIDEECLPNYLMQRYPKLKIGEYVGYSYKEESSMNLTNNLNPPPETSLETSRVYRICGKLGYDSQSTLWLGHDERTGTHKALRVLVHDSSDLTSTHGSIANSEEITVMLQLRNAKPPHAGYSHIVHLIDHFPIHLRMLGARNPGTSDFQCLTYDPKAESVRSLYSRFGTEDIPVDFTKRVIRHTLHALDYLHMNNIIHNGFGSATWCSEHGIDRGSQWRMPEAMLSGKGGKGSPVIYKGSDIWSLGAGIWGLLGGKNIITEKDKPVDGFPIYAHLQQLQAILGPPPAELLSRGDRNLLYLSTEAGSRHSLDWGDNLDLEPFAQVGHKVGDEWDNFMSFIKSMLHWLPEKRWTAKQLLRHEWLRVK
ncbi:MAG: hypothetical protein M1836_006110 [Candelina mexicana]|nr:MAG: hypothetical protein M1836_006110 [Candelina mexicana]